MFSSEIKETIYIAIGCMLAAAVLGLIAFTMSIRGDLAVVNNNQLANQRNMSVYTTLNRYNGETIYGDDVIVCIREFSDSDIEVYVNNFVGVGSDYYTYYSKNNLNGRDKDDLSIEELMKADRDTEYYAYLVFGEYNRDSLSELKGITKGEASGNLNYSEVTAVKIEYKGKKPE